ncbi:thioesterase II family protein [Streptomyces sp. NPDC001880]
MNVDISSSIWIRRHPSALAPRLRLLCLPHAGGSAAFFRDWAGNFGDDVEVLVARYPGRHERINDPLITSMDSLADAFVPELLGFTDVPLAIFGHSMGATLGYEIALRLLRRHRTALAALMVSGRTPPHLAGTALPDSDDTEAVMAEVRRLGGTDSALLDDLGLRELVLPALRADFKAVADYAPRPGAPLPFPVFAYVGDADPDVDVASMRGWSTTAAQGFDLRVLPGNHFYLVEQQAALMQDIRTRLSRLARP